MSRNEINIKVRLALDLPQSNNGDTTKDLRSISRIDAVSEDNPQDIASSLFGVACPSGLPQDTNACSLVTGQLTNPSLQQPCQIGGASCTQIEHEDTITSAADQWQSITADTAPLHTKNSEQYTGDVLSVSETTDRKEHITEPRTEKPNADVIVFEQYVGDPSSAEELSDHNREQKESE